MSRVSKPLIRSIHVLSSPSVAGLHHGGTLLLLRGHLRYSIVVVIHPLQIPYVSYRESAITRQPCAKGLR